MLKRIVSGGQTGADRGALDAALGLGFPCGGWCPRGRRAEDGAIPPEYPVRELDSARYIDRTRRNVEDADGTLILAPGPLSGGTRATAAHARRLGRPCLVLDIDRMTPTEIVETARAWILACRIETLNVAGPRGSSHPGLQAAAEAVVAGLISSLRPA